MRFFDRVKVGALDVLDDCDCELVALRQLSDDGGYVVESSHLSCANSPLSGHELVPVEDLGDEHGLQNAVDRDTRRELFESVLLQLLPRLVWIASDTRNRDLDGGRTRRVGLRDESLEASSEAGVPFGVRRRHRDSRLTGAASIPVAKAFGLAAAELTFAWVGTSSGSSAACSGRPSRARNSAARRL